MTSRSSGPARRPVAIALCLMLACVAVAVLAAATAHASEYKMVACSGDGGAPPYSLATNSAIFEFHDWCDRPGGGDAAEANAFMRIAENQPSGQAADGAYLAVNFTPPSWIFFRAAGGYTREPSAFHSGWHARFYFGVSDGASELQMAQAEGLGSFGARHFDPSSVFTAHLWPWPAGIDFTRWTFEMICASPAGCDRAGLNAADLTGIVFALRDLQDSRVDLTNGGSALLAGRWVSGAQRVGWSASDKGSGLRLERLRVDGAERYTFDYQQTGACDVDASGWARSYRPCPSGPNVRSYDLDTASLLDGAHDLSVCTQDFGQYQGLNGTGSQSCETRTIRTDNHAPAAPTDLRVLSSDPNRYRSRFGASFGLPADSGSPIAKAHYQVVDASGRPVTPERVLTETDPTGIPAISGPGSPGAYRLRVWLEDELGHSGPPAEVEIPRDAKPPAAPQGLTVTPPTTPRGAEGFDVRWHNIADEGSQVVAAHYQVLGASGAVAVPTKTVRGWGVQEIASLQTPRASGPYTLRLWLEDQDGNVGAPVTAPLAYGCVRSDASAGRALSAGLGARGAPKAIVRQGKGAVLGGRLVGTGGGVAGAALCVFGRTVTDQPREFLGFAASGPDGRYRFAVGPGASRELTVRYRSGHREVGARALLGTVVRPTIKVRRRVVAKRHYARFLIRIPGPDNDRVVVVLQAKQRKGWRAFRRCRTNRSGRCRLVYRFGRTTSPATYLLRAQVRRQRGYPYLPGNSKPLRLRVVP